MSNASHNVQLVLADGGRGTVQSFDGVRLRIETNVPLPPGMRIVDGKVGDISIRGKVIGAERGAAQGLFRITLKLQDLSREGRERLLVTCAGPSKA